jgi:endonuclease
MFGMPIYDKPVRLLMRQMVDEMPVKPGQTITRDDVLNWFAERYPKIKEGTVAAHLIRLSTNAPTRLHYSAKPGEDDVFLKLDGSHFRLYDPANDPPPIREGTPGPSLPSSMAESEGEDEPANAAAFAYESDLRNFLSKNLSTLEPGLRLYEEEGIKGIEFPVGGRFIDILALDAKGAYVVIELKVSRGYDRVFGQLRRYMGWIAKNHAEPGQLVRGVIVAREISEDLILACFGVPGVELFEYQMSVAVKKVAV